MKIFIVGASGFIGQQLFIHLSQRGHQVGGCSRSLNGSAKQRFCDMSFNEQEWQNLLAEYEVVINCVGIFNNGPTIKENFDTVHHQGPIALFQACQDKPIKVIQISALGAELEQPCCEFLHSKKRADEFLKQSSLDYKIFYPGIIIGRAGKSTKQLAVLANLPIVPLILPKQYNLPIFSQQEFVNEITQCIEHWSQYPRHNQIYYPVNLMTLLNSLCKHKSFRKLRTIEIPTTLTKRLLKYLPNFQIGVFNRQSIKMLDRFNDPNLYPQSNRQNNNSFVFSDKTFSEYIHQRYWCYYFIAVLSFIWCWSGLASLINLNTSVELINTLGLQGHLGLVVIYAGALLDLLLGVLIWWPKFRNRVLYWQIAVIIIYSLILTIGIPEFLLHPFAPVIKNAPILLINFYLLSFECKQT